jgi:dTDP-4-dehydrorhamnose reductase
LIDTGSVLVIGAEGQLGSALSAALPDVTRVGRRDLDLTSSDLADRAQELINAVKPRLIVNCAAFTGVDRAESKESESMTVNAYAVGVLAEAAARSSTRFVTFSTDYVFDGTNRKPYVESDPPSPLNAYGRSKALGEAYALAHGEWALVIRTSWLVSSTHSNFVSTILQRISRGLTVTVVDDQWGCPTMASDLARATVEVAELGVTGILHLTNEGAATWFSLAREAATSAGIDEDLINPCTTADYPTAARRPRNSTLGSERLSGIGVDLPPWQESLPRVVSEMIRTGLVGKVPRGWLPDDP